MLRIPQREKSQDLRFEETKVGISTARVCLRYAHTFGTWEGSFEGSSLHRAPLSFAGSKLEIRPKGKEVPEDVHVE